MSDISQYFVKTEFASRVDTRILDSEKVRIPQPRTVPFEEEVQGEPVSEQEAATIRNLLEELEHLPARKPVSLQVVALCDDPDASSAKLGSMVSADAALTARLLRLANSAYYGLGGRVSTLQYAITVVGFSTVRAMALADAVGAGDDKAPEGFWEDAALVGVAASAAARWTGARAPEALCTGLLHDLGKVLLYRADTEGYGKMLAAYPDGHELLREERKRYGIDHAAAAGQVLAAWALPEGLVKVVRTHHEPIRSGSSPEERTLALGKVIAGALKTGKLDRELLREVSAGRVRMDQIDGVLANLKPEAAALTKALCGE